MSEGEGAAPSKATAVSRLPYARLLEELVDHAQVLQVSPFLKDEISEIRDRFGITERVDALNRQPLRDENESEWDNLREDISSGEYLPGVTSDLMTRYGLPCRVFFQQMLLTGEAADLTDVKKDLRATLKWEASHVLLDRGAIQIRTDPPYPKSGLLPGRRGWLDTELRSVTIEIEPWTTLEDIKRIWHRISLLQQRMVGRDRARRRKSENLARDLILYELLMVEDLSASEAIQRWDLDHPDEPFPQNEAYLKKEVIPRLDRRMRPKWAPSQDLV